MVEPVFNRLLDWSTGTMEGLAFMEMIILLMQFAGFALVLIIFRRIGRHEKECVERDKQNMALFSAGSEKFAVFDERSEHIQKEVDEIKSDLKALNINSIASDLQEIKAAVRRKD